MPRRLDPYIVAFTLACLFAGAAITISANIIAPGARHLSELMPHWTGLASAEEPEARYSAVLESARGNRYVVDYDLSADDCRAIVSQDFPDATCQRSATIKPGAY